MTGLERGSAGIQVPSGSSVEVLDGGPMRCVLRVRDELGSRILKLDRPRGLVTRLRERFRGSRAAEEYALLLEARARGLPVPEPLFAFDFQWKNGRASALFLSDLGTGETLEEQLATPGPEPELHEFLRSAGRCIREAWDLGLRHRDLHAGNVYRSESGELFLLDLQKASFEDVQKGASAADFVPLYLSLPWPEQRDLRALLFGAIGVETSPRFLAPKLENWLERRLRRCLRDSGEFHRIESGMLRSGALATWPKLSVVESLKTGRRGAVDRVKDETRSYIRKTRKPQAAWRLWRSAHALELRRIPVARALGIRVEATSGEVLSEDLSSLPLLSELDTGQRPMDEGFLRSLARSLGTSLARLHSTGLRFRDLRGDNFGVTEEGQCVFLDLDGVRSLRGKEPRAQAKDLGRLLAYCLHEAPICLHRELPSLSGIFLRSYLRETRALGSGIKSLRLLQRGIWLRSETWRKAHGRRPAGTSGGGD